MINGSFNVLIKVVALIGIFIGGCIFNVLNDKNNSIYSSWIVHLFCDLSILIIGLTIFNVI